MDTLTEEQRKRMEENRRKALEKRALSHNGNNQISTSVASKAGTNVNKSNFSESVKSTFRVSKFRGVANCNLDYRSSTSARSRSKHIGNYYKSRFVKLRNQGVFQVKNKSKVSVSGVTNNVELPPNQFTSREIYKGHCILLSRKRFFVGVDYRKEMVDIFKSIPGALYDEQTKKWNFSINDHDKLISLLRPIWPNISIKPLPRHLMALFLEAEEEKEIKEFDLSHMDQVLVNSLLPFQKVGLYFGIHHNGKVLIADDMGLGKTIQGIAIAHYFMEDWPLLVLTPSSVKYSWLEAFRTWLPSVGAHEISVINSSYDPILNDKIIVIMSYSLLNKMLNDIKKRKFRTVIFDESHFLKSRKSARTKAAQTIVAEMSRVIMLSGTPALSRPIELYTQVSALCPKYFSSLQFYGHRYCNAKRMPWGWDYFGSSNLGELQLVLEELVMLRRLKSDVITELPAKCRQMVILDPSRISNETKIMKALYEEWHEAELKGMTKRGALLKYFHKTGAVKIPAVCEYIQDLLESDKKFLCFAHHQSVMDSICNTIKKKKIDFIRIDGSVSAEDRKKLCDHFQSNDTCKVAVLSITAACCGITLTAASLVVFAELFWNPGILTQAEDRAHRIGQKDSVVVQYLVAKGTADDEIWPLIQMKLNILNRAGLSQDSFKSADTVVEKDSFQPNLEDFWKDLELSEDFEVDIPEKRQKFDI